jgi:SAM-dependent methyltransferase
MSPPVSPIDAARWYDAFYRDDDYAWEAERIMGIVRRRCPDAVSLLDVGCGSGRHLALLARRLRCTGVDIDRAALRLARARVPSGTRLVTGDITSFELNRRFDVVTCLFSVIGFARTAHGLRDAVARLARHLEPGGVLVVEPWRFAGDPVPGPTVETAVVDDEHVVRLISERRVRAVTRLEIAYAAAGPHGVRTHEERHELGLFSREQYAAAFDRAGVDVEFDPVGLTHRGLYVGRT